TGKGRVGGRSRYTSAQARELADTAGMREAGLFGADILSDVASVEAQGVKAVTKARRLRHPVRSFMRGVRRARTGRESLNRTG
ncbi:hypothetical protein, partial [Escherichia coli]|uniref:hypothetical protein n=1 Tax=Escherichia coli TaxID=562 RepID=UPI000CCA12FD